MSEIHKGVKYSKEHEWTEARGNRVRIGISDFAQKELGDIVFVDFPAVGAAVQTNDAIGTIESVKTVSDLFSPVNGTVVKINEALNDSPEQINSDPYGEGWIVEIEVEGDAEEAIADLLSPEEYEHWITDH